MQIIPVVTDNLPTNLIFIVLVMLQIIHSKLSKNSVLQESVRSAVLYDGSITDFDSRLYGFDIGTCLEVLNNLITAFVIY